MNRLEIKKGIYWVGAKDWSVRDFHGYKTNKGTTYNAYLIVDEKIALIDAVKPNYAQEMIDRIREIIDPAKIDYVISNHVEMDHSGAIPDLMQIAKNAQVITSINGDKGLKEHYQTTNWNLRVVQSGEKISLGKKTLSFLHIPMVHWPDSMATYVEEDKLLIPNDAFGQHYASDSWFDDQVPFDTLMEEAAKYYANIVYPFGTQVERVMDSLAKLDFDMIAPSHGLIWRKNIDAILKKYRFWARGEHENKAVIIYDSMWGSTEQMANTLKFVLEEKNIPTKFLSLKSVHISDIMTDVLESKYIFFGAPTLNTTILPTAASMLSYIKGLKPKNKVGFSFGSYGWSLGALKDIDDVMSLLKWKVPVSAHYNKYRPNPESEAIFKDKIISVLNA